MEHERCYSVLVVSSSEKFNQNMQPLLPEKRFVSIRYVNSVAAARREANEYSYDICIINAPLPDEFGTRLALDICDKSGTAVMLLVKAEHYADIDARVAPYGVFVLSKPTSAQAISQTLTLLCATRERLRRMEQKTTSFEDQMEGIRLINHAKWLLIENRGMTENEAHKYIEKQAMDNCISKRAIAERIIQEYK